MARSAPDTADAAGGSKHARVRKPAARLCWDLWQAEHGWRTGGHAAKTSAGIALHFCDASLSIPGIHGWVKCLNAQGHEFASSATYSSLCRHWRGVQLPQARQLMLKCAAPSALAATWDCLLKLCLPARRRLQGHRMTWQLWMTMVCTENAKEITLTVCATKCISNMKESVISGRLCAYPVLAYYTAGQ